MTEDMIGGACEGRIDVLCSSLSPQSRAGHLHILTLEGPVMSMATQMSPGGSPSAQSGAGTPPGFLSRSVSALARAAAPATFALASIAGSVSAQVGLVDFGPLDPVSGFPNYYTDANGLRLGLCQNLALCGFALPNPVLPLSFPTNYPVEQFYWGATGDMPGTTARVLYFSALEASFAGGVVAAGQQMVFTRFRLRASGLVDGGIYTITHPYG